MLSCSALPPLTFAHSAYASSQLWVYVFDHTSGHSLDSELMRVSVIAGQIQVCSSEPMQDSLVEVEVDKNKQNRHIHEL